MNFIVKLKYYFITDGKRQRCGGKHSVLFGRGERVDRVRGAPLEVRLQRQRVQRLQDLSDPLRMRDRQPGDRQTFS